MKKLLWSGALLMIGVTSGGWLSEQGIFSPSRLTGLATNRPSSAEKGTASAAKEKEVLYWVAPMDPNYRRDKPGKSPMGMELIPVYAGGEGTGDDAADVTISPAVVNNLGVRTAVVEKHDLQRRVDAVGYVAFDEARISHIHLRTSGWIERLLIKSEGERVKKGQLLFELYSPTLVNAQEEFLQATSAGNKQLGRASTLKLISLGMTTHQVEQIQKSRKTQALVAVYAPQNGVVSRLKVRQGMRVKPEMDIMSLADLSSVWLQTEVFERQANWVKVGGRAEARLAYLPGQDWQGTVDYIYPTLNPITRTLKVRLRFDNPGERMKPNMYAKVSIFDLPKQGVLAIPREAVIRSGHGERVVMALGGGRFNAQKIRTGMESGNMVEVISGLKVGEKVVTSAQFLIDSQASLKGSMDRMEGGDAQTEAPQPAVADTLLASRGIVRAIIHDERKIKLTHEPIPALNWPAMTMDFTLAEGVSAQAWKPGQKIDFILRQIDAFTFEVIKIDAASSEVAQ